MALAASTGASAAQVGMSISTITGSYDVYLGTFTSTPNPPAWPLTKVASTQGNAQAALGDASGNANFTGAANTGPGGNVELGKFGSATTMSGSVAGKPIDLRSLQYGDWAADGKALGYEYVGGFSAAYGLGLTQAQLKAFVDILVPDVPTQPAGWQRLSDPNISYVYIDGHQVNVGLAGFLDVEQLLEGALGAQLPARPPGESPYQASEVVHVCLGGVCDYLYGFVGTASGVIAPDRFSYSANYNVAIPEPESLALLGLGLIGVFVGRRRRA
ncbi:MAG TPA: NF038130 family PEP-CTERM protein [Candidatus Accumulibacter phosphatis]|jgi:hypothetical protein|nr:PEP-CTERM sorting domain-containing protein [Accumulibacter sp.]HRL78472.1 NF038130 family PEP-CTERM protein [Candidatus Accumulibacter phosphatis]HRQ97438.1 NF038130 family PEP-CTERM protein [Candidatus Accumulibacter phosphatis]